MNSSYRRRSIKFFLGPAIIALLFLTVYPFVYNIFLSFSDLKLGGQLEFIGVSNYLEFFGGDGLRSLIITLTFVFGTVLISLILGFAFALLVHADVSGKPIFRSILTYPLVISPAAVGLFGLLMWNKDIGIINYVLSVLRLPTSSYLSNPSTALLTIIVTDVWQWSGFVMLVMLAGLVSLPKAPYEAAIIDGASTLQIFRYITLPLMSGSILVAILFRTMDAFKVFDLVYFMTGGGPGSITTVLNLYGYRAAFKYFRMGYSATISIIVIVLATVICQFYMKIFYKVRKPD